MSLWPSLLWLNTANLGSLVVSARDQGRVDRAVVEVEGGRPRETGGTVKAGEEQGEKHWNTFGCRRIRPW